MGYEAVKRERCPNCHNNTFYNNFRLREGHHARVFVECIQCGALVARYILHAYVDPNYSLTTTLHRLRFNHDDESVRHVLDDIQKHQTRARVQFDEVKAQLEAGRDSDAAERKIYDIIHEEGIVEDG